MFVSQKYSSVLEFGKLVCSPTNLKNWETKSGKPEIYSGSSKGKETRPHRQQRNENLVSGHPKRIPWEYSDPNTCLWQFSEIVPCNVLEVNTIIIVYLRKSTEWPLCCARTWVVYDDRLITRMLASLCLTFHRRCFCTSTINGTRFDSASPKKAVNGHKTLPHELCFCWPKKNKRKYMHRD